MSANAGEDLKPIARIASGGELARIMLALKNVLAEQESIATLVFDEVDTGVSGRAAQKVAEKLAQVSRCKQVRCVTHLPQLAAMADTHFSVEKGERNGRTFTRVERLSRERRMEELARLTSGDHITDADAEQAAEIAQATEFISAKPEGFDSPIAQGGSNVSGGQKQRLSIARAIAKHPQIYLFDDSFSALDYKTDVTLRRALKAQTDNATVIIVAQRISTVLHANQILVLDEGKLVGKGTHAQLMVSCPEYQEIARSQLSQKELALDTLNTEKEGE